MWNYSHMYQPMIVHVIRSTRKCTHLTTMSRWNTWVAGLFDRELALLASFRMVTARSRCYMKDLPWPRARSVLKRKCDDQWWPIELMPNCKSSTWCLLLLLSGGICNWDVDFSWHRFGAYHHCFSAARSLANSLKLEGFNDYWASINQLPFYLFVYCHGLSWPSSSWGICCEPTWSMRVR